MAIVAGADGCKSGWVVVTQDTEITKVRWFIAKSIDDLFHGDPAPDLLAIDIPIGIPESGPRLCDGTARRALGAKRGTSVFRTPVRAMLSADSYEHACQVGRAIDGCGLSRQCWSILPKIQEVDHFLRDEPKIRERVKEVCPEISFWALSGRPMSDPKRSAKGQDERLKLLEAVYGDAVHHGMAECTKEGAKADDVLDAFVALWSASRIHSGTAVALPTDYEIDRFGLRMQILA